MCVHVPSTFSDGHATVEEMLADARAAGAGALLLTDHDSLEARRQGWEGWHDGVLLLVGHEISPRGGHLLAFGLERRSTTGDGGSGSSRARWLRPAASGSRPTRFPTAATCSGPRSLDG